MLVGKYFSWLLRSVQEVLPALPSKVDISNWVKLVARVALEQAASAAIHASFWIWLKIKEPPAESPGNRNQQRSLPV